MSLAERAFIMVWDGMRPDLISPQLTPNLARFAASGVRMSDSHAVFPTVTRANSASLSTGMLPGGHGIVGNSLYAPLVDPRAAISIGDHNSLFALIEVNGGRLLPCDTLADRVAAAGGRTVVVSSGTPGSAFLCHPRVLDCPNDRVFNPAIMLPEGVDEELVARLGPIPEATMPNTVQNTYFTQAVAEYVLPELDPRLLVFWHNDPDKTQHSLGFGSPAALAAIRDADANFGLVLAALEASGSLDQTAIVVVSDHGYASIEPSVESIAPLMAAGLGEELEAGRLVLSRNGFSLFVNVVASGDDSLVQQVAEAFMAWEHAGAIFSGARGRPPVEGTLPLALIGLDGALAPDVLCTMTWDDTPNPYGHRGRSTGFDTRYLATHGGISSWEIRNTFVLAGPGLKSGVEDPLPSGNLDLAPTMLHLLGLDPPAGQHGRILTEALLDGPDPAGLEVQRETVTTERDAYQMGVRFSTVGSSQYLDYGWGACSRPMT